jgi:trans-aconitate 2-methyltransferase
MIAAARRDDPAVRWVEADVATWTADRPYDLVFSNAALHWVPDHARLFPHLLEQVGPGGALAVQMPVNQESPAHRAIREVAERPPWTDRWGPEVGAVRVAPPERYYDWLAPTARGVEVWATDYLHVLPDPDAIVEWVKGTTLRPYLTALRTPADQAAFLAEVRARVETAYPRQPDGRVLFPFRRLFVVARR